MRTIIALTNQRLIYAYDQEKCIYFTPLSGMHNVRLVIENNRVVGEETLLASERQHFLDIIQEPDEALYALTDGGRLDRIDK